MNAKKIIKLLTVLICAFALIQDVPALAEALLSSTPTDRAIQNLHNIDPGRVYETRYRGYEQVPEVFKNKEVEVIDTVKTPHVGTVANDNILLYVEKVNFEGNTVFSQVQLKEMAAKELIGRDVTLTRVGKFAEKVTKMYQDKGYITSFAFLPPQTIKDKTVTVKIVEGKIGDITISGNKFSSTNFIKYQLLKPYYMEKGEILNVNDIRQGLIELNEKGYISGSITLAKSQTPLSTDLKLGVKEHQPFTISLNADNAGRESVGKERLSLFIADNNLTGHGDVLSVGGSIAENSFSVGPQYSVPIGNRGDKLYASYAYSYVEPGGGLKAYNYSGGAHIYSVGMQNPIYKSRNWDVKLNTSFNVKEGEFKANRGRGKETVNEYSIRTLETKLTSIQKDKLGRTYLSAGANVGLPFLGGTNEDNHFMALTGGVTRQFWLPNKGVAMLRFNGQVSPDHNIPSLEQFQAGGFNTVRGYDEGLLLGKSGWTAGVQVNTPIPFLPESMPIWKNGDRVYRLPIKERIQLVGFYDCGYAKTVDYDLGTDFIQSVGTGLRVYLTKYLTASVDFGFPIGERPDGGHRYRTHFFLTSNIL